MPKKQKSIFICQSCGNESPRWMGKCSECNQWNTMVEELSQVKQSSKIKSKAAESISLDSIPVQKQTRQLTQITELDRVLGGGFVPGSILLLGGAPGIGKSTLLLQVAHQMANESQNVLYISAEESIQQIKMRADRLDIQNDAIHLIAENLVEMIGASIEQEKPGLAIVDSIQTIYSELIESLPGSVSQVRFCAHVLTQIAKNNQVPIVLIGHVTKDGNLAGPRILEHLVDGLFLFEGDHQHLYRILRCVKNRFGSANEVGIFEMTGMGMREVANPSEYLLQGSVKESSGSAIASTIEGTRAFLVELQALVSSTHYQVPQRTVTGFDHRRLSILLAVLEKRAGLRFASQDVFVNTAGGLYLADPGSDLAVVMALVSSLRDKPIPPNTVFIGEVGLSGDIRRVPHIDARIREARRMGYHNIYIPTQEFTQDGLKSIFSCSCLKDVVEKVVSC